MNLSLPLTVVDRFVFTLQGLFRAVAARSSISVLVGRGAEVLPGALILAICQRVQRVERRIVGMLARFQAGTLRVATSAPDGAGRVAAAGSREVRAETKRGVTTLPRRFAWLIPLVPCEAAGIASQLRVLMAEPEMVAFLAAAPQAIRVLAPLFRMLGIEAQVLAPQLAGAAPAVVCEVETAVKQRVRKKRPPVDWGRIPLPRGVLAWARRDGFGKI